MRRYAPRVQLNIVSESEQPVSRIRLMKFLFLLRKETDIQNYFSFYNFLPYKYGPYSFYADEDIRKLKGNNYFQGKRISINREIKDEIQTFINKVPANVRNMIENIVDRYRELNDRDLVNYVYENHSFYTILSDIRENSPERPVTSPSIYTIGYEGVSIDQFLHVLIEEGMEQLIDVRKNPLSRKFGFSKRSLKKYCGKINVDYLHYPVLGIPSERRKSLSDASSYEHLFEEYENQILDGKEDVIRKVEAQLHDRPGALLCFEADPSLCHRKHLAERIKGFSNLNVDHIEA